MRAFYLEHPDTFSVEATILDRRGGAVLLDRSPFFPGGGGQLADRGTLTWAGGRLGFAGVEVDAHGAWHRFAGTGEPRGTVLLEVDAGFRRLMCELHTLAHVLNALVYNGHGGALLTGAQLSADGSFRVDFDLPGADGAALRELEGPMNDVIRQDLAVTAGYLPRAEAEAIPGMFRSRSVAPPPSPDGLVRVVEIAGLDRQACGGTHLASTGQARLARILKIDNKGRHNRRIKVGVGEA
ncbi:alanyl-tRNA editing protein [Thalassobaculum sp.]|uniref:alanyl-tRNA editing protein n=1 Tax=Thalassobaculum sp. TaxID=2022740 RepID=UPI0032ED468F